jgi:hypothetical protein
MAYEHALSTAIVVVVVVVRGREAPGARHASLRPLFLDASRILRRVHRPA